jgi:hypothetical protein
MRNKLLNTIIVLYNHISKTSTFFPIPEKFQAGLTGRTPALTGFHAPSALLRGIPALLYFIFLTRGNFRIRKYY